MTTALIAEVAAHWITTDIADRLIETRRIEFEARNAPSFEILGGFRLAHHPCGQHLWLELPDRWEKDAFLLAAEEQGVALNGAEWFAFGHVPVPNAVRISISNAPDRPTLRWALERLRALLG